ncbi:MAG: hypothetical protein JWO87_523 [Phycisphaerales bacterium]|nr:hypothetical protein [Phycisphaerales bacterium]
MLPLPSPALFPRPCRAGFFVAYSRHQQGSLAEAKQQQQAAAGAAESRKAEEDAKYGPPPGVKTYTERARVYITSSHRDKFSDARSLDEGSKKQLAEAAKLDNAIRTYLSKKEVSEKVSRGMWEGIIVPGMTREQLDLFAYVRVHAETEHSQTLYCNPLQFIAYPIEQETIWRVTMKDGTVSAVARPRNYRSPESIP